MSLRRRAAAPAVDLRRTIVLRPARRRTAGSTRAQIGHQVHDDAKAAPPIFSLCNGKARSFERADEGTQAEEAIQPRDQRRKRVDGEFTRRPILGYERHRVVIQDAGVVDDGAEAADRVDLGCDGRDDDWRASMARAGLRPQRDPLALFDQQAVRPPSGRGRSTIRARRPAPRAGSPAIRPPFRRPPRQVQLSIAQPRHRSPAHEARCGLIGFAEAICPRREPLSAERPWRDTPSAARLSEASRTAAAPPRPSSCSQQQRVPPCRREQLARRSVAIATDRHPRESNAPHCNRARPPKTTRRQERTSKRPQDERHHTTRTEAAGG